MKAAIERYRRLIIFTLCSTVVGGMFYFYQDDYYKWSCEEEDNSASCFLMAKKLLREGKPVFANNYLQMSCSKGYQAACNLLK